MKTVTIVTSTRADFGLLFPLIKEIGKSKKIKSKLVVTGSHLSKDFGYTAKEIETLQLTIDKRIKLPLNFSNKEGMAKCVSVTINKFVDYFSNNKSDMIIVLGDRYEILGVSIAASMLNIPIAHIAGGETTQGAVDEFIRHSITKMSYLHFTSCEEYRKRVIQLGENPKRVSNVGALCVENINNLDYLSLNQLSKELNIDLDNRFALVTYHPVTMENNSIKKQMKDLIDFMNNIDMNFIITKANADSDGMIINNIWDKEAKKHSNWRVVHSLGFKKYLTLMKNCEMVIGNSSSGITEAPVLKKPVINIGDRQKGRFMCINIISCGTDTKEIEKAYKLATNKKFIETLNNIKCPFGDGHTSKKIVKILEKELEKKIDLKKEFYDINF